MRPCVSRPPNSTQSRPCWRARSIISACPLAKSRKCFCNGPSDVKSPRVIVTSPSLASVRGQRGAATSCHQRGEASPSKTRDPFRRPLTALLTASPLPSSRRRDLRGAGSSGPAPNRSLSRPYAAAASRPQRKVVPSTHMRCRTTASLRASATFARFMPRRLATSSAQRLRAEKRTARVSRMCAAS